MYIDFTAILDLLFIFVPEDIFTSTINVRIINFMEGFWYRIGSSYWYPYWGYLLWEIKIIENIQNF